MKKFISGFIAGALIFSMLGVFAVTTYVAKPADFKVLVNGKEFVSDPPALEVEGRTYLPLRAMGDALGVPVNWNQELYQAEVGDSSYYKNDEDNIYYEENKGVIDFGARYGIEPEKVTTETDFDGTELITYYYLASDGAAEYFSEYIDYLTEEGYVFSQGKKINTYPVAEDWYLINHKTNEKMPFAAGTINDMENLKVYIAISVVKQ